MNRQRTRNDYGSPTRVKQARRGLARLAMQERSGEPLGPMQSYLRSLLKRELYYAEITRPRWRAS